MSSLQPYIPILVAVLAAWVTGWWNQRGKKTETTAAPYEQLAERLSRVEHDLDALRLWAALVIPIHADLTARWPWWREQDHPPAFPSFPANKEKS